MQRFLVACTLATIIGCGGRAAVPTAPEPKPEPEPVLCTGSITIGPPIGAAPAAVAYLEELIGCEIFTWCDEPDVIVKFDTRDCGQAGADAHRISINDPERCEWVEEDFGLGLAVHELMHVMGHWTHDEDRYSVMAPRIEREWYIMEEDIEEFKGGYCDG